MKTMAMLGVALLAMLSSSGRAMDLPGPLVSPAWLAEHAKEVVIIDVRDDIESFTQAPQFDTDKSSGKKVLSGMGGHVPGALLLDFSKVRVARTVDGRTVKALLPERAEFETLMRDVGVEKNKPIIVVSLGQSIEDLDEAARTYWSLKVYGQKSVAILDGGVAAWIDSGQPVSQIGADSNARRLAGGSVPQRVGGRQPGGRRCGGLEGAVGGCAALALLPGIAEEAGGGSGGAHRGSRRSAHRRDVGDRRSGSSFPVGCPVPGGVRQNRRKRPRTQHHVLQHRAPGSRRLVRHERGSGQQAGQAV